MRLYDFDLVFTEPVTDEEIAERLFEVFDAAGATITPALIAGRSLLSVHIEGETLEAAIDRAVALARTAGAYPIGVELEVESAAA